MLNTLKHKVRFSCLCIILLASGATADSVVVFNEVMYHPQTGDNVEWVELYNQMGVDIDISDWSLRGGVEYTFRQTQSSVPGIIWWSPPRRNCC